MEILKTDILIIGGGSAGCLAAIAAKDFNANLDVTIFEKANIKRSGTLATGMDAFNIVAVPGLSTPEEFVKYASKYLLRGVIEEDLQYQIAEKSFAMVKKLEEWGIKFEKDDEGQYVLYEKFVLNMDGWELKPTIACQVNKRNVRVLNHTMATSLISDFKRVHGATGLNIRTGEFIVCSAKSTILTSGGCARFGLPSSGYLYGTFDFPGNAGDGYAMAYRAGATLAGFEYVQTWFDVKDLELPLGKHYYRYGVKLVDENGNKIDNPWDPEFGIHYLKRGRGPLYEDFRHIPEEKLKKVEQIIFSSERKIPILSFFKERNLDLRKDPIEYTNIATCLCGGHGASGVKIDANAKTSLQGLYAAGDVAYVPWQMLPGAFIYGEIAGRAAAKYAKTCEMPKTNLSFIHNEEEMVFAPKRKKHGIKPETFEYKLRRVINEYLAPPRNETKMRNALSFIKRFRDNVTKLKADDWHELGRAIEASFILDCAEMNARSSLERKESRWGLNDYRSDFPERDDKNWLKHVLLKIDHETGEMTIFTSPVKKTISS